MLRIYWTSAIHHCISTSSVKDLCSWFHEISWQGLMTTWLSNGHWPDHEMLSITVPQTLHHCSQIVSCDEDENPWCESDRHREAAHNTASWCLTQARFLNIWYRLGTTFTTTSKSHPWKTWVSDPRNIIACIGDAPAETEETQNRREAFSLVSTLSPSPSMER
jgi:hypothetical protein